MCVKGYYMKYFPHSNPVAEARPGRCTKCADGTACGKGTSIESIDVEQGYFRFSNKSYSVYQCELVSPPKPPSS